MVNYYVFMSILFFVGMLYLLSFVLWSFMCGISSGMVIWSLSVFLIIVCSYGSLWVLGLVICMLGFSMVLILLWSFCWILGWFMSLVMFYLIDYKVVLMVVCNY